MIERKKKTHCIRKHEISAIGRNSSGACKECVRELNRNPDHVAKVADTKWKNDGILNESGEHFSYQDFNRHFQIQGGKCNLCGTHQSETGRALCVDHDHKTGKFRALLCLNCNRNKVGNHTLETALQLVEYLK